MSWDQEYTQSKLGPVTSIATGFNFPSSLAFDNDGNAYVAETGIGFAKTPRGGRIWKVSPEGEKSLLAQDMGQPITGLVFHDGALWVSQGTGRIDRLELDGSITTILDNLPTGGNYHTGMVAFGPDGKMYWGQGSMTNMGIVGLDALIMGWLKKLPHSVDIPGYDVTMNDVQVETRDPFNVDNPDATIQTGPFTQIGQTTEQGTVIKAQVPATAAIHRANPDGSDIEMVAWGVRNAFGLGFLPDGRLIAIDQGPDDRGSRPVGNVPDYLWEIEAGKWYGWPDFMGGVPVTDERWKPETGEHPSFILANHDELPKPEKALVEFTSHTAATKFAVDPNSDGKLLAVTLFGDETPMTAAPGHPKVGRALVLINTDTWKQHVLLTPELMRPIDVQYNPIDGSLWVLDFGAFEMENRHSGVEVVSEPGTGTVWRVENAPVYPKD